MSVVTVQELIDAGVHFGHQARRWNPKMDPYIFGKRHKIHLIDLKQTIRGLYQATHFVRELSSTGAQILFLGTKRQIRSVVESEAKRCNMPAITERWIGGTLTNFNTVRERLTRLEELEAMEADGSMEKHKKKAQAMLRREMRKIQRNLEGVRDLHGLPGAIIIVDPRREDIAMKEAQRMNVPVLAILDTDCDPDLADIVIPANDDAISSVLLLLSRIADAVSEGTAGMDEQALISARRNAQDDPRAREVMGRRQDGPGGRPGGGRGRSRRPEPGGRLGRRSTGRFAERAGGHADNVSVGGDAAQEAATKAKAKAAEAAAAEAPASEAPASEAPAVGAAPAAPAPVTDAVAPEAPAPAPEAPAPAPEAPAPAPEAPAPESGEEKKD